MKYSVIDFEIDVELFDSEGEEYTARRNYSRSFTDKKEKEDFISALEADGGEIISIREIPMWQHKGYQILALLYAVCTLAWRREQGTVFFYNLMEKGMADFGRSRIAAWFDSMGYHFDHKANGDVPIWIASERKYDEAIGVDKTRKGILKRFITELIHNHRLIRIEKLYEADGLTFKGLAAAIERR